MDPMAVMALLERADVDCYTRAEWGTVRPNSYLTRRGTHPMPAGPASYHFLHISVTSDTDTVQEGFAGARQIESFGLSTPPMVSYHDLVTNEMKYFQGQDYGTKGTHTINDLDVDGFPYDLNLHGYATALMQNVGDEVSDEQVKLIAMIAAAREKVGVVRPNASLHPHRKFAAKSCPGDKAVARLGEIVDLKREYFANGLPGQKTRGDHVDAALDALRNATAADGSNREHLLRRAKRALKKIPYIDV